MMKKLVNVSWLMFRLVKVIAWLNSINQKGNILFLPILNMVGPEKNSILSRCFKIEGFLRLNVQYILYYAHLK